MSNQYLEFAEMLEKEFIKISEKWLMEGGDEDGHERSV